MEKRPEKYLFQTIDKGVKRMKDGRIGIKLGSKSLSQYYKQNPFSVLPNVLTTNNKHVSENFILTYNSPLQPILNIELLKLRETGVMTNLEKKWIGEKLQSKVSDPLHNVVLSFGQTILIFSLLGVAIGLSMTILGLEILWQLKPSLKFFVYNFEKLFQN